MADGGKGATNLERQDTEDVTDLPLYVPVSWADYCVWSDLFQLKPTFELCAVMVLAGVRVVRAFSVHHMYVPHQGVVHHQLWAQVLLQMY